MSQNPEPASTLNRRDLPVVLALVAMAAAVYLSRFFAGVSAMEPPRMMDVATQWMAGYKLIGDAYRQGFFPLWNAGVYSGMPWVAYTHAAVLYPFNAIFLYLYDFPDATTLLHFVHATIAIVGVYLLARDLGASRLASFMAATAFTFSGFYFFMQSQLSHHATMAWLGFVLFFMRRGLLRMSWSWLAGAGAMMALMIYGGDAEGFIYALVFIALFILLIVRRESFVVQASSLPIVVQASSLHLESSGDLPLAPTSSSAIVVQASSLHLEAAGDPQLSPTSSPPIVAPASSLHLEAAGDPPLAPTSSLHLKTQAGSLHHNLKLLLASASTFALAGFLALPMITTALELQHLSIRSSSSPFDLQFTSMFDRLYLYLPFIIAPWKYYAELHPNSAYNNGLAPFYFGALPLALSVYALFARKQDPKMAALAYLGLAIIAFIVLRRLQSLDPLLSRLPLIGLLHTVERALELAQLAFLLASALALDRLRASPSSRAILALAFFFGFIGAITIGAKDFLCENGKFNIGLISFSINRADSIPFAPLIRCHLALPLIHFLDCHYLLILEYIHILGAVYIFAGALLCLSRFRLKFFSASLIATVLFISIIELFYFALIFSPKTSKTDYFLDYNVKSDLIKYSKQQRFVAFSPIGPDQSDPELFGMVEYNTGLDYPFGHMRLPTWRYFEFLRLIDSDVAKPWDDIIWEAKEGKNYFFTADLYTPQYISNRNLHLLNLLSVRSAITYNLSIPYSSPYYLTNPGAAEIAYKETMQKRMERHLPCYSDYYDSASKYYSIENLKTGLMIDSYIPQNTFLKFHFNPGSIDFLWKLTVTAQENASSEIIQLFGETIDAIKLSDAKELKDIENPDITVNLSPVEGKNVMLRITVEENKNETYITRPAFIRDDAPFQLIFSSCLDIFENRDALPRVFVVYDSIELSHQEALEFMGEPARFDPGHKLVFEEGEAPPTGLVELARRGGAIPGTPREAEYKSRGDQDVEVTAETPAPGWLFVSDAYYPGWKAYLDGLETRIQRADLVFRAVFVPDGRRQVRFSYQPISFRLGLFFALTSLVVAGIQDFARRARRRGGAEKR